jgi:hypothetical protein
MYWLLRPTILIVISAAFAVGAVALVVWSLREGAAANQAQPLPLRAGDREIVWLYPATSAATWERFVAAARRAQAARPELEVDDGGAFPLQTTAVPELALRRAGTSGWLRIRWYKLTSDLKTHDWVLALTTNRVPPLAIIGGSNSDQAIALAHRLAEARGRTGLPGPLLLLTQATADEWAAPGEHPVPLIQLYAGRTFRFCFTNRQMAEAVTAFLWSRDNLRPDADPAYVAYWQDDPYSGDLADRFIDALQPYAVQAAAHDWAWVTGFAGGGSGVPIELAADYRGQFRAVPRVPERIPSSIGTFHQANRWEAEAAKNLMDSLDQNPTQRRPLLILPGGVNPSRRLLHSLLRDAPGQTRRFVVATGDAIPFNTVFRDRNLAWPIQDLPFPLVFFCHRNPVDPLAGFAVAEGPPTTPLTEGSSATGTEDVLLFRDILEALFVAAYAEGRLATDAETLGPRLHQVGVDNDGRISTAGVRRLFDADGNRRSGTGEHIVCVLPETAGWRVLPQATIEVWALQEHGWQMIRKPLQVEYEKSGIP